MRIDEIKTPEEVFFLFSSVCLEGKLKLHKITKPEYERVMQEYSSKRIIPPRSWFEEIFEDAIRRQKSYGLANFNSDNVWDLNLQLHYWMPNGQHNKALLDEYNQNPKEQPLAHVRFCSTYLGEVTKVEDNQYQMRFEGNRLRTISKGFVSDAKIGDKLIVHRWKAIVYGKK